MGQGQFPAAPEAGRHKEMRKSFMTKSLKHPDPIDVKSEPKQKSSPVFIIYSFF